MTRRTQAPKEPQPELVPIVNREARICTIARYGEAKQKPSDAHPAPKLPVIETRFVPGLNWVPKAELEACRIDPIRGPGWMWAVGLDALDVVTAKQVIDMSASAPALQEWAKRTAREEIRSMIEEALRGRA